MAVQREIRRLAENIETETIVDRDSTINDVYRYIVAACRLITDPTPGLIALAMEVHRSTVSRHVKRLAKLGFVATRRSGRRLLIKVLK